MRTNISIPGGLYAEFRQQYPDANLSQWVQDMLSAAIGKPTLEQRVETLERQVAELLPAATLVGVYDR